MTIIYVPPEEAQYTVTLTKHDYEILKEIIKERNEQIKEDSIEALVERAIVYKKAAKELYPKIEFEVYVDKNSKRIHIGIPKEDDMWSNMKIIKVWNHVNCSNKEKSITSERVYIE